MITCNRFDISEYRFGTDRVKITLHEFAVATGLGPFAAPHRCDVITFERCTKCIDVLCGKTSKRNGQVESHSHIAAAVVLKSINLTVSFVAALARQEFPDTPASGVSIGAKPNERKTSRAVCMMPSRGIITAGK